MPEAVPLSPTPLTPGQRWLCCLAVAIKLRDPVLITQLAEQADQTLTPTRLRRTAAELIHYPLSREDWQWLRAFSAEWVLLPDPVPE